MDEVVLARGCHGERGYDAIRVGWDVLGSKEGGAGLDREDRDCG